MTPIFLMRSSCIVVVLASMCATAHAQMSVEEATKRMRDRDKAESIIIKNSLLSKVAKGDFDALTQCVGGYGRDDEQFRNLARQKFLDSFTPKGDVLAQSDALVGLVPKVGLPQLVDVLGSNVPAILEAAAVTGKSQPSTAYYVSVLYLNGIGVPKNQTMGQAMLQRIAATGTCAEAEWLLGMACRDGKYGYEKDTAKALAWLQRAADHKCPLAQNDLGIMYEDGNGVPKDGQKAVQLLEQAATGGSTDAMANLANIFIEGKVVPQDLDKGIAWAQRGANLGDPSSQLILGIVYERGLGVSLNFDQAAIWYGRAVDNGNERAQQALAALEAAHGPEMGQSTPLEKFRTSMLSQIDRDRSGLKGAVQRYRIGTSDRMQVADQLRASNAIYEDYKTADNDYLLGLLIFEYARAGYEQQVARQSGESKLRAAQNYWRSGDAARGGWQADAASSDLNQAKSWMNRQNWLEGYLNKLDRNVVIEKARKIMQVRALDDKYLSSVESLAQ